MLVTGLFLFGVFTEADGTINDSWKSTFIIGVFEGVFCFISLICRVIIIVGYTCCGTSSCETTTDAPDNTRRSLSQLLYRCCCCVWSALLVLLSVVFLCMTLHDYLKTTYYYTSDGGDEGCDPMVTKNCMLPYPSSHFLQSDETSLTGYRVAIQEKSLPFLKRGVRMSAEYTANRHDGFSVSSMLLWHLSGGMRDEQFVGYEDVPESLLWNSSTLLINSHSETLHPHFTEKDYVDTHSDMIAYMMPARSLEYNTTYVAVVQSLTDADERPLPAAPLTRKYIDSFLLGGEESDALEESDARYARFRADVFPMLLSLGVNLSAVQLVWDLHTASMESTLSTVTGMGEKTRAIIAAKAAANKTKSLYRLKSESHDECGGSGDSWNRGGKMSSIQYYDLSVPWYLINNEVGCSGTLLN